MTGVDRSTGKHLGGLDHLRQSVEDILRTRIGTRVMRRDYGSRLPELIDAPLTPETLLDIYAAVHEAVRRWEPRLRLTRVRAATAQPASLTVDLVGFYRHGGEEIVLQGIVVGTAN